MIMPVPRVVVPVPAMIVPVGPMRVSCVLLRGVVAVVVAVGMIMPVAMIMIVPVPVVVIVVAVRVGHAVLTVAGAETLRRVGAGSACTAWRRACGAWGFGLAAETPGADGRDGLRWRRR